MRTRSKQLEFKAKDLKKPPKKFGGSLLKSNPKTKRTLDSRNPIHLVLRGIKGGMRQPKVYGQIHQTIYKTAERHGVKIYKYANVGNHLHILICVKKLRLWPKFIRALTGHIAYLVKAANKDLGKAKYWKHRPFTHIIGGWKKAYKNVQEYIYLNQLEGDGRINRRETKTLQDLRLLFEDT